MPLPDEAEDMAVGIVETGNYGLSPAIDNPGLSPPHLPQLAFIAHQHYFIARDGHQLGRGAGGVHGYHVGVTKNKVGGRHLEVL